MSDTHLGFLNRFKRRLLHCPPLFFFFFFAIFIIFFVNRLLMLGHDKVLMLIKCLFVISFYIIDYFYFKTAFSIGSDNQFFIWVVYVLFLLVYDFCCFNTHIGWVVTANLMCVIYSYFIFIFLIYLLFDYLFRLLCMKIESFTCLFSCMIIIFVSFLFSIYMVHIKHFMLGLHLESM